MRFYISDYAKKWNRPEDGNFAAACYNDNSLAELSAPHSPSDANKRDCETWGISPQEWSDAIEAARLAMVDNAQ